MAKLTYKQRKKLPGEVFAVDHKKRKYPIQDKAYLAGIIDGEGSVFIERRLTLRPQEKSTIYTPRISIANTDIRLIDWLKDNFGGHIIKTDRNGNWKVSYCWQIASHKAIELARMVMPYLKLKGVQAHILSCFEYEAIWSKGGKPEDSKMPISEITRREELYQECKILNRKGKESGAKTETIAS